MEIMQFAITMEKDGEQYYRTQAVKNKDNGLKVVFEMLARDEAKHAQLLQDMADDVPVELESDNSLEQQMDLFLKAPDFKSTVKELPDQAELYHAALEKEKQSIDLYTDLQGKITDAVSQGIFAFLVKEETRHYNIIEEIFRHVNRPNEWVESAEFGIREEY